MTTLTLSLPAKGTPEFQVALNAFLLATQARINAQFAASYPNLTAPRLTVDLGGSKYFRIVRNETYGTGRSVHCFVRIADGAVLKAAGWKTPAKHARGSIYVNAGQDAVTEYGAKYLR